MWQLVRTWFLFILIAGFLVLFLWLYETKGHDATQPETASTQSQVAPEGTSPAEVTTASPSKDEAAPLETPVTEPPPASAAASASVSSTDQVEAPAPQQVAVAPALKATEPLTRTSPSTPVSQDTRFALQMYPDLHVCPIFSPLDPSTQLSLEANSQTLYFLLPIGKESVVHALFPATVAAIQTRDNAYDLYLVDNTRGLCLFYGGLSQLQPGVSLNALIPCGTALGQMVSEGKQSRLQLRLTHFESSDWTQGSAINLMAFLGIK